MSEIVLKIENLYKQYRLGVIGSGTLRDDLQRFWARVRGKEDPLSKVGANNRHDRAEGDYVWALMDINFEVKRGEVLGIIGKNGAGKSTLLKILSKVTSPTKGNIYVDGRISSLLEVGTGFHPELTGRENIFLNGVILGMKKREIRSKMDEIVDFAGVEKYLDTPVKRYSSGMYVRLAFAVAAHLEPEILIVDEVLAVGDVEFQKKAIGKMQDVSKSQGRTVLFVSHNMGAVQKLCGSTILLNRGELYLNGDTNSIIRDYYRINKEDTKEFRPFVQDTGYVLDIKIINHLGTVSREVEVTQHWEIRVELELLKALPHFILGIGFSNSAGSFRTVHTRGSHFGVGKYVFTIDPSNIYLEEGEYFLTVGLSNYETTFQYLENCYSVEMVRGGSLIDNRIIRTCGNGVILNPAEYDYEKLD